MADPREPSNNPSPQVGYEACPTCRGTGLIWRGTSSARRGRVNEDHEPCVAAFRCPDCPDDGTGNSRGTGRRPLVTCTTEEGADG